MSGDPMTSKAGQPALCPLTPEQGKKY